MRKINLVVTQQQNVRLEGFEKHTSWTRSIFIANQKEAKTETYWHGE